MAKKTRKTDEYKPLAIRPTTHRRLKWMAALSRPHTTMIDLLEVIVEDAWERDLRARRSAKTLRKSIGIKGRKAKR